MIVYKYGALKPTEGFDLLLQQLRDANIYRNAALEIALARRAALFVGCDKEVSSLGVLRGDSIPRALWTRWRSFEKWRFIK